MGFFDFLKGSSSETEKPSNYQTSGQQITLIVDSSYPGDQGGGKVRIDPETMLFLNISPGDLVVIEGQRKTVAKVWRLLVEDWNQHKARIDNFIRTNAGVGLGEKVTIRRMTNEIEVKRIVLAPPEGLPKNVNLAGNPNFSRILIDFPVTKNDLIPISLGMPFVQSPLVGFKIIELVPEDAVLITKESQIDFLEQSYSDPEEISDTSDEGIDCVDQQELDNDQKSQNEGNFNEDPIKIIKIRYAKGEISKEEYEEMEQVLKK
ncbi:MAG: hypothetical protein GYA23_00805 [Methanomicrobiales archaeon]|nr:hypothetical protein [Methanomicrobiales archaeon]